MRAEGVDLVEHVMLEFSDGPYAQLAAANEAVWAGKTESPLHTRRSMS